MTPTFSIPFPDGSELPITVAWETGPTPPTNKLSPHGVIFGTSKKTAVTVTLTPGEIIPPPKPTPPAGPPALVLPAGFEPVTAYKTRQAPATWTPLNGSNEGYQATTFMASQVAETATGWDLTAVPQFDEPVTYQSGWIQTAQLFKAGCRIDFDCTLPEGQGLWPACWLVATGQGEIDVQENLGGNPGTIYATLHSANGTATSSKPGTRKLGGANVFSLCWEPGRITIAVDYEAFAQWTAPEFKAETSQPWPFDTSLLPAICNLAVGSASEWGGAPNSSTAFPAVMGVSSVTAWT